MYINYNYNNQFIIYKKYLLMKKISPNQASINNTIQEF